MPKGKMYKKSKCIPKLYAGGYPQTMQGAPGNYRVNLNDPKMQNALDVTTGESGGAGFDIGAAGDMVGTYVNALTRDNETDIAPDQTRVNYGQSTGSMAVGGAAKGAKAGAALGPVGAAAGAVVGAIGGLLGGGKERKRERREQKQLDSVARNKYQKLNMSANLDPYGSENTFYMAGGGMVMNDLLPDPMGPVDPPTGDLEKGLYFRPGSTARGKVTNVARRDLMTRTVDNPYGDYTGIADDTGKKQFDKNDPTELEAIINNVKYLENNFKNTQDPRMNYRNKNMHHDSNAVRPMVPIAEDGMMVGAPEEGQQEGPQKQMVDIEKGEILIDPVTLDVVRKYDNPNRYKKHAKNTNFEPIGNFTSIEEGQVVIPKKYAGRYKNGDVLTKKSIVLEILKNQRNEPAPMVPGPGQGAPQAAGGYGGPDNPFSEYDPFGVKKLIPKKGNRDLMPPRNSNYVQRDAGVAYETGVYDGEKWVDDKTYMDNNPRPPLAFKDTPKVEGFNEETFMPAFAKRVQGRKQALSILSKDNTPADLLPNSDVVAGEEEQGGYNEGPERRKGSGIFTETNLARALNFAPTAFGMINASRMDPEAYDENTQFDAAKSYTGAMETNPSIEASRAAMGRSVSNRNKMLNNINSPSVRAEAAAGQADLIQSEGEMIQGATNFAMDARNKKRASLGALEVQQGQGRYQAREALRERIAQNGAKRRSLMQAGISEGVTNFGKQVMDNNKLNSLNSMLEYYKVGNDGKSVDNQQFGSAVLDLLSKGGNVSKEDLELAYTQQSTNRDGAGIPKGSRTTTRYKPSKKK
jgi:hypothetical protein